MELKELGVCFLYKVVHICSPAFLILDTWKAGERIWRTLKTFAVNIDQFNFSCNLEFNYPYLQL